MSLRALLDLVVPVECAVCHQPGHRLCPRCRRRLGELALGPRPVAVRLDATVGAPHVHAWGRYAGPLRPLVSAWKDGDRRDLTAVLEGPAAAAVHAACDRAGWRSGPVLVVPVPSAARAVRRRGDAPVELLAAGAVRRLLAVDEVAHRLAPALAHTRLVADQAGLGVADRRTNLAFSMAVKPLWRNVVRSRRCVVLDDVVTTGSTLAEASRALAEAGAQGVVAAAVAATERRHGPSGPTAM